LSDNPANRYQRDHFSQALHVSSVEKTMLGYQRYMGVDGDEPLDSLCIYFLGNTIACSLGLSAASNAEILHFLFETLMRLAVSADPFSLCAIQKVQDALQK
jgi:hypothetical protein